MRAAREGTHEQVIAEDESIAREVGVNGVAAGLSTLPLAGVEFLLVALGVTVLSLHWVAAGIASGAVDACPVDL